ncbi:CC106 protein, partial [Amia calva]|nr:CC106 protein [Amia calva]
MQKVFKTVRFDRNTLALTAPLAEIMLAAPEFLTEIEIFKPLEETLLPYAQRCAQCMTNEVKQKIKDMKANKKLLPITYKLNM